MELPHLVPIGGGDGMARPVPQPPVPPDWQDVPLDLSDDGGGVPLPPVIQQAALTVPVRPVQAPLPAKPASPPPKPPAKPPTQPPKDQAHVSVNHTQGRRSSTRLVVTSGFGVRTHPITHQRTGHEGVDLAAPQGSRILASRSGKVTFAGWIDGYGKVVIIDHGQGVETRYAHASSLLVKVGQSVVAGQTIAKVGSTGRSTGPHLHFEIRRQGRPVDPWPLLAGGTSKAWKSPL